MLDSSSRLILNGQTLGQEQLDAISEFVHQFSESAVNNIQLPPTEMILLEVEVYEISPEHLGQLDIEGIECNGDKNH